METVVIAKAIVQDEQDRVLLLRRSQTDIRRPGEWDFPGGTVEPSEEFAQGVVREINEETGIEVAAGAVRLVYAGTQAYDDASVTRLLFVVRVDGAVVTVSSEHDAHQWASVTEALQLFPHPFYAAGLAHADRHALLAS